MPEQHKQPTEQPSGEPQKQHVKPRELCVIKEQSEWHGGSLESQKKHANAGELCASQEQSKMHKNPREPHPEQRKKPRKPRVITPEQHEKQSKLCASRPNKLSEPREQQLELQTNKGDT
eukprot:9779928-Ditylum_brightwellii.AAC.1